MRSPGGQRVPTSHSAPAESLPTEGSAGFAASCASPSCWCRDRRPCYPSDLTDQQWAVLEPRAREVMAVLTVAVGRPMVHDLRAMCDAVGYVVKSGVEWRALPVDFPRGKRFTRYSSGGTAAAFLRAGHWAAGVAAAAPGPCRAADGLHHRLTDDQGP
jgi:transposase